MRLLRKLIYSTFFLYSIVSFNHPLWAQASKSKTTVPVFVDQQGVLRWSHNKEEAAFFGVNYTVPFAYGYRSHQALGVNLEKAIDQDVYHLARLGFDAFRVHVWDTEISDSTGNLLENEHLRLFDYLIFKLKQRNIKILITPIAFWGPGYPEKDEPTPGFSSKYNKREAVTNEQAFLAQEKYLQQFFNHVNPYTKTTYQDDPDVIAAEVNNEPHHSGPKERTTEYVNRMVKAIRSTGWTKPIFYNISESPKYADAVAKADVQGFSFQWYPTGLVANRSLQGNYLPHVDRYHIPFDTIPQFAGKARMVYEFDAGDIFESYMYPAMARSFRGAGFQWATQFAYDPLATAYGNTEYQTHYVNLAYTPSKAISLMIASKVFHQVPRLKSYGTYPADSLFDVFRVSYQASLSEMNAAKEFYHSNSTQTQPVKPSALQHIAGVGSSPLVTYEGTGAYFLDKLENGVWRLEVMPDAIHIRDPFAKASPKKEVTRIQWQTNTMQIKLADLGDKFNVRGLNEGNPFSATAKKGTIQLQPGTYLLIREGKKNRNFQQKLGAIGLKEFVAPQPYSTEPYVVHHPKEEVSANKPFTLKAHIVGIDTSARVSLVMHNLAGVWETIPMKKAGAYTYQAEIPATLLTPGLINYRIVVQLGNEKYYTFPGGHPGNPWAWDYVQEEQWQTYVASAQGALSLFNATQDRNIFVYPNLWKSNERQLTAARQPGQLILRLTSNEPSQEKVMGFQLYVGDKLQNRLPELEQFKTLVVRAKTNEAGTQQLKVALATKDAAAFASYVQLSNEFQDIEIPLSSLQNDSLMLLPRPYPGFHPFWFKSASKKPFNLSDIERLELVIKQESTANDAKSYSLEVESVWLKK